jgi:DeoR family transcriptional regulator of aga operon
LDEYTREQAILAALTATGKVAVADLAVELGVSTVTIRKDLSALERRSLLQRVRGGAVSLARSDEGAFEMRMLQARERKQAIARAAAATVQHGDVIAIDSATTSYYLVHEILDRRNLVVLTNGLRVAMLLMERSSARVLMPGGVLRRSAGSLVGRFHDGLETRGRIAKGYFGVVGLSTTHGLMDLAVEEADTKRSMAAACDEVYGLFDSSKIEGFGLHSFAPADTITGLYTDDGASPEFVAHWQERGVPVSVSAADTRDAAVLNLPGRGRPARTPRGERTKEL